MSIETMKLALEALENSETLINGTDNSFGLVGAMDGYYSDCFDLEKNEKLMNQAITALRQAIEQAQEPVQVTIKDFVAIVEGKEDFVGRPVYWAQWPNEAAHGIKGEA